MEQTQLFEENESEAIRHAVAALGGPQVVGHMLWPTVDPIDAGIKLANCLNRHRKEKLSLAEFFLIMREARKIGCHVIAAFVNKNAGYAPPMPIEPKDEIAELQRKYIQSVEDQKRITKRMEDLITPPTRIRSLGS